MIVTLSTTQGYLEDSWTRKLTGRDAPVSILHDPLI
jgi:hypothetical protein